MMDHDRGPRTQKVKLEEKEKEELGKNVGLPGPQVQVLQWSVLRNHC